MHSSSAPPVSSEPCLDRRATDPWGEEFADEFGRFLTAAKRLDDFGLRRARAAALRTGERFDHVLTKLGLVSEGDLHEDLARFLNIPLYVREDLPRAPVLPARIDLAFVRRHGVLPLAAGPEEIVLAVTDPLDDDPIRALAYLLGLRAQLRAVAPAEFERAVQSLYLETAVAAVEPVSTWIEDDANEVDLQRLKELASEAPVIRLVNQILAKAVEENASDVHVEPGADAVAVRYRIDGALRCVQTLPWGMRAALISRIKIMAKLDIAERRFPQDGRIKLAVRGADVDLRVSTIPGLHGESVVLRILDRKRIDLDFKTLGFADDAIDRLRALMRLPNGLILVTGPTGSGKTTTLYAALQEISAPEVKVVTVEDPIEYQLAGIVQVQAQSSIELDFPRVLRAVLRHDPDIVMIGEIRDLETARIAIQASLTGHLVLSTLHTNSAAAAITRLVDMGVENYLIASTLRGVLAQRLVRRPCARCMAEAAGEADRRPDAGCETCRGTGFSGRTTIWELLTLDSVMQRLIAEGASEQVVEQDARAKGMVSLYDNGLEKAQRGETTLGEVLRVTRAQ